MFFNELQASITDDIFGIDIHIVHGSLSKLPAQSDPDTSLIRIR